MRVTRHQHHKQILFDYSLHNQTLENVQPAKCLGITITDNMDWGQHVSEISSRATKTLGFLRRNLAFAPRSTKEVAYKTLVQPKLEYAAPIWSPHSKLQIEKVQRTAARWTCRRWRNTSSVGEMLDELEWPSLEARRDQSSLLFHKIHCGAVSIKKKQVYDPCSRALTRILKTGVQDSHLAKSRSPTGKIGSPTQGAHPSGKSQGNLIFLQGQGKVREFCKMVREIRKSSKVREKSGNFKIMLY